MKNWKKWLGLERDFPADGVKPADPKIYATHAGGVEPPPEEEGWVYDEEEGAYFLHNPPRDKPALQIDHPKGSPSYWSTDKLNRNIQDFKKSDRELNLPTNKELIQRMNVQNRELTQLEAADTILKYDADRQREMMEEFKEILARSDTVDIDLFHIHKELNNMEDALRALKTRSK